MDRKEGNEGKMRERCDAKEMTGSPILMVPNLLPLSLSFFFFLSLRNLAILISISSPFSPSGTRHENGEEVERKEGGSRRNEMGTNDEE